jgi:hypothetical protein
MKKISIHNERYDFSTRKSSRSNIDMPQRAKLPKNSKPFSRHQIFPFMYVIIHPSFYHPINNYRKLPAELRNRIYELALCDEDAVYVSSKTKGYRRVAKRCVRGDFGSQFNNYRYHNRNDNSQEEEEIEPTTFSPNLLAVSKTIHAEAASFLYTQPITVADNYALLTFLNQIGPQHASMIREITITSWCFSRSHKSINYPAMSMLGAITNVERLNINCSVGYFRYYSWNRAKKIACAVRVARKIFRDCHPWLEAIGQAKGDVTAGIEMLAIDKKKNFDGSSDASMNEQMDLFKKELSRLLRA